MLSRSLFIALGVGAIAMMVPIVVQSIWYKIDLWKGVLLSVVLTLVGTVGTDILFFIETGLLWGTSFYGAVFLVPVVFLLAPKLFRIPYGDLMDLCAPAECIMLAIMKYKCFIDGCCKGRVLFENASGVVRFPSQIAEMINALLIFVLLMMLSYRKANRGSIYPWYLVIYGGTRFILNFFRDEWSTSSWIPPFGTIWSLVAIAIGIIWLLRWKRKSHIAATD